MSALALRRVESEGGITGLADCRMTVGGLLEPAALFSAASDSSRPILLLRGFALRSGGGGGLVHLARKLECALGRKTVVVPRSGKSGDLRECAREVDRVLSRLAADSGFEYADVVGYSMGGLVATYLLKCIDRGRRVRNALTLGTPHRGVPVARLLSLLSPGLSRVMRQMSPGSGFLEELKWMPLPDNCKLISIAGENDQVVPARFARLMPLPRHRNLQIPGVSHSRLLLSAAVLDLLRSTLSGELEPLGFDALAA